MAMEERNKQLVQEFYDELFNEHNLSVIDDCLSADFVCHENRGGGRKEIDMKPEEIKDMVRRHYTAFPDQKTTIDEIRAEGDKVVTRWTTQGTQYGDFLGIPPTRKQVKISGTCTDRIADDKIVESWVTWELNDLLSQLEVPEWRVAA